MIPETCSICKHPYVPPSPEHVVFTMRAKFEGTCRLCHEPVEDGDIIAHMMPSDTWICFECTP
jgi:hypothetical protein